MKVKSKKRSEKKIVKLKAKTKVLFHFFNHFFVFTTTLHEQLKNFILSLIAYFRNFWEKVKSKKIFESEKQKLKVEKIIEKLKIKSEIFNFENCKRKAKAEVL